MFQRKKKFVFERNNTAKATKVMRKLLFLLVLTYICYMLVGCEAYRYERASTAYYEGEYRLAIEDIDNYLENSKNGAYRTNSELMRSKAYLRLAQEAYSENMLTQATHLAQLANSEQADTLLADCYYDLAQEFLKQNKREQAFQLYDIILTEISDSEYNSEIIYAKIQESYSLDSNNFIRTWDLYKRLYAGFPGSYYEVEAQKIVRKFMPDYLSYAMEQENETSIDLLLELLEYPVGNNLETRQKIADIYIRIAENSIQQKEYLDAQENFIKAVQYNPSQKDFVKQRLMETADEFIMQGKIFAENREFDKAKSLFNHTFEVIPGYKKAIEAYKETQAKETKINKAKAYFAEGRRLESVALRSIFPEINTQLSVSEIKDFEKQRFEKILSYYQQANDLDPLPKYKEAIFYTENIIKYWSNPDEFAVEIIKNHKSFIIEKAINQAHTYLIDNDSTTNITDSGWEVLVASGDYQYEVRYSLIGYSEKFYFKWLVNLRTKEITPANNLSQNAMLGIFYIEENENEVID